MNVLTLLQIVTISLSAITLIGNFLFTSKEKIKDNLSILSCDKNIEKFRHLRDAYSVIATMSAPDVIKENKIAQTIECRNIPSMFLTLGEAQSKFISLLNPYKKQEAIVLNKISELVALTHQYYNTYDAKTKTANSKIEEQLMNIRRVAYIRFSLIDWANWEIIISQVSDDKYDTFAFDKVYDRIVEQSGESSALKNTQFTNEHLKMFKAKDNTSTKALKTKPQGRTHPKKKQLK